MNARARALLVAAATLLSTVTIAAAPAAAAPTAGTLSLYAGGVTVHTANGQGWTFSISADVDGQDAQANPTYALVEAISRTVNAATKSTESHSWQIPRRSNSTLTFTPSTGRGALNVSNVLTTVKLTFQASSHRNAQCTTGSERVYAGTLTGQATLHTGLKAGGTVGGSHLKFAATAAHLSVDNNCASPLPTPSTACQTSAFFGGSSGLHSLFGLTSASYGLISLSHSVSVKPAGSTRSDTVGAKPSRAAAFNSKAKTLQIYGSTKGVVVGAGKFVGATTKSNSACKVGSVKHTQHTFTNYGAKFTNTTGNPLVGKSALTGKLTFATGAHGYYTVETWS